MSSVLVGLQAQKETLMRSLKEQEAELANLRQAAQTNQTTMQQERERSQREMSALQSQLQAKVKHLGITEHECCVKNKFHIITIVQMKSF